jgi:hypothetical protein
MPKFTLTGEHTDLQQNPDGTKVSYEFYCEYLDEIVEHIELFLRGCGFNPTGKLDFIHEDEFLGDGHDGMGSTLEDYPELHSEHYYDTDRNKPVHEWTAVRRGEE